MPDIFFNCSRCTQSLVVDAEGIGLTVPCPTCGCPLVIPAHSSPPPVAPEVAAPKTTASETKAPETTGPEVAVSKTTAPEPTSPGIETAEATAPKTKVPEAAVAKAEAPKASPPETTIPETTIPKTMAPETALPGATAPGATVPKATVPGTKASGAAVSKATVPDNSRPKGGAVSIQELINIVLLTARDLECEIDIDAAALIARSANGSPENAKKRLRRVLHYGRSGTVAPVITLEIAREGVKVFDQESQQPPQPARNF